MIDVSDVDLYHVLLSKQEGYRVVSYRFLLTSAFLYKDFVVRVCSDLHSGCSC